MKSEQPNNRRILPLALLAVVVALLAGGLTFGLVKMTGSDSASDQTDPKPSATAPATENKPREVIAMVEHGEQHALLNFEVYPQGGQVTGTYTLVHFDGNGRKVEYPKDKPFKGTGSDTLFKLSNLGDQGPVEATLSADGTRLTFDQTFGVEETEWQVIDSESVFDGKVDEYAKRFESCSKKHDYNPCEGVS
ncbi:hypothetical protein BKA00_007079 [Actinomadura coerulea]|uniref:Uncharacterized protein n=1 Tax=Actinomadura coerulea TaxID=46159 RepID=A0A7X0G7W5_9ACTN|nr:hypothetical protein [Actinomadura coerulea]MBB6400165.1 hypothetical protein [Actinomadura coerulea]GGQ22447.1 hypothetical protein GCM10010187_43680 [Actinomadura coerulea]